METEKTNERSPRNGIDHLGPAMSRLVATVAYDLSCEACVVYRFDYGMLYPICSTAGAWAENLACTEASWVGEGARWIVGEQATAHHAQRLLGSHIDDVPPPAVPRPRLAGRRRAGFAAAVPIRRGGDRMLGLLVVADAGERPELSVAQDCALSVYAGQLAVRFGRWLVRETPGFVSDAEQLRVLRPIVDRMQDAVLILRSDGATLADQRIVYCNEALVRRTGRAAGELFGRDAATLLPRLVNNATTRRIETAVREMSPAEIACTLRMADGTASDVELSLVPVRSERGACTHWVGLWRETGYRERAERLAAEARRITDERDQLAAALSGQESAARSLAASVHTDTLTGLYNRRYVDKRLQQLIDERRDGDNAQAADVLFIDLDGFKQINDTYGHHVGDELLVAIAGRLAACVRSHDTLARLGGDEFVIVIEEAERSTADFGVGLCDRIIAHLARPFRVGERRVRCGCSIGLVRIDDGHGAPADILREADQAMYTAKRAGRGRYARYTGDMRRVWAETSSLRTELRAALDSRAFKLAYQPIVVLDQPARVRGVEALLRWRHPQRGEVAPDVFIPLATEIGRMGELGAWVLETACSQLYAWGQTAARCHVAINVTLGELQDPDGVARMQRIIAESGVAPARVAIEVDEPTLAAQSGRRESGLSALRNQGIRVVLDDFGHDAASLSRLAHYDIDALKIGPVFVADLIESARSRAVVASLVALGNTLGIDIIAEGIETDAQLVCLRELGCPLGQGHVLTAPGEATGVARTMAGGTAD